MISKTELEFVDTKYFNIIQMGCFNIYVQSKNTKHFWGIQVEEYSTFRHFKIYHKHNSYDEYHRHRDARSLSVAIEQIKSHDTYQLNERRIVKNYTLSETI